MPPDKSPAPSCRTSTRPILTSLFEAIFNDWSAEENKEVHISAVSSFVDEMVVWMTGQAASDEAEAAGETPAEEAPATEAANPEVPPAYFSNWRMVAYNLYRNSLN